MPGHPDQGRGDLVFTDGAGRYTVVGVRVIDGGNGGGSGKTTRRKRTQKRRKWRNRLGDTPKSCGFGRAWTRWSPSRRSSTRKTRRRGVQAVGA